MAICTETIIILFTDLVSSTELSFRIGPEAGDELRQTHFLLLRQAIAATDGTEVKNLGDGLMVVFSSVSRALTCAVGMQQGIEVYNRLAPEALSVRIGVSMGEATTEDGDYFGEPVVEAARLCATAAGGQILTTDVVRQLVGRRSGHTFSPVGELTLKGLPDPVPAVEVTWTALLLSQDAEMPLQSRLADLPEVGYFGRVEERRRLAEAFKSVAAGHGREVVLISGEPGIGKSTLAAEAARSAVELEATALFGRCDEDLGLPYQPVAEALTHYVTHAPQALLEDHVRDHGGELGVLVPALRRRFPELPPPTSTDADAGRYLLFAAVAGLLSAAAQDRTVVLVMDDLQWADKPSLMLFRQLISALEAQRILLVGTYRDSDLHASHPLLDILAALWREPKATRLDLHGLVDAEVIAVMEAAAGHAMDTSGVTLAHAIARETGGNPFFVSEVLHHLAESGGVYRDTGGRWVTRQGLRSADLPQSVREVVGSRVARLGEPVKQVLTTASVIGEQFEFDLLLRLVDVSENELLDILDRALRALVVTEIGDIPGRYRFAHALIQHTLYQDLGATRRSRAHRQVATALEELCGDDPGPRVAELAHHWAQATQAVDLVKALDYARQAGQLALATLAPDEALRWFTQALQLFEQQTGVDEALQTDLLVGLGTAQRHAGDPAHRETLLKAARLAQRGGDTKRLVAASLANNRGYFSAMGEVDTERVAMLEATLAAISADGDRPERARLLATLAVELTAAGDWQRRRELADQALDMARRLGAPACLAQVLTLRFLAVNVPETLEVRLAEMAEACALTEALGDPVARFFAAAFRAWACIQAGDLTEVDRGLEQMSLWARQLAQPPTDHVLNFYLAWRSLLAGEHERSEAFAMKALQVANESGNPEGMVFYAGQLFAIRRAQGRLNELVDMVAQVSAGHPGVPVLRATLATTFCELDRDDEARRLLAAEAASAFASHPHDLEWLHAMTRWADVCVHLGADEPAELLYDCLAPFANQIAFSGITVSGSVSHSLGGLAGLLGRYRQAEDHLTQAIEAHERLQAPYHLALTRLSWARVLLARSAPADTAQAIELAQLAHAAARQHGFATVERQAADILTVS